MRLLLDTHILLAAIQKTLPEKYPAQIKLLEAAEKPLFVSTASIWEIAIKMRLGKLDFPYPLENVGENLKAGGLAVLSVELRHVVVEPVPVPPTRDPFDRLLLAQCQCEGLKLLTLDRVLADHPLSVKR